MRLCRLSTFHRQKANGNYGNRSSRHLATVRIGGIIAIALAVIKTVIAICRKRCLPLFSLPFLFGAIGCNRIGKLTSAFRGKRANFIEDFLFP